MRSRSRSAKPVDIIDHTSVGQEFCMENPKWNLFHWDFQYKNCCFWWSRTPCFPYTTAESLKIKIRTSSRHKANLSFRRDEVQILIFDDPAELWPAVIYRLQVCNMDSSSTKSG